jgi:hypothetical protein
MIDDIDFNKIDVTIKKNEGKEPQWSGIERMTLDDFTFFRNTVGWYLRKYKLIKREE